MKWRDALSFNENKPFTFSLAGHAVLAGLCLAFGLVVQLYTSSSKEEAVASALSTVNPVLPDPIVAELNLDQPANLSPQQWKQLQDMLRALPEATTNILKLRDLAYERQEWIASFGDVVFRQFDELPKDSKSDWQALANIKLDDSAAMLVFIEPDASTLQQTFLNRPLTVKEVQNIIRAREGYYEVRKRASESTAIIDRLRPVVASLRFTKEERASRGYSMEFLKMDFKIYIAESRNQSKYGLSYPAGTLPPLDLTAAQVIRQMSQAPLSSGSSSADRAGH